MITPDRRCNCYDFGRRFKCAHTECVKLVVDKNLIPEDADIVKLHGRRNPGKPAQAKGKYVIQDYALNIADPDEGGDQDMDDDNNNDNNANEDDYDNHFESGPYYTPGPSSTASGGNSSSSSLVLALYQRPGRARLDGCSRRLPTICGM